MNASDVISSLKNTIIKEIVKDEEIVKAIDSPQKNMENWLPIYLNDSYITRESGFTPHIFTYNKYPDVIEDAITFILVLVQIPKCFTDTSKVQPRIELWIYSHKDHIYVEDKMVKLNRNDYIAELLIKKFNTNPKLQKNKNHFSENLPYNFEFNHSEEGAYDKKFLYRKVEFTCLAYNKSLCDSI